MRRSSVNAKRKICTYAALGRNVGRVRVPLIMNGLSICDFVWAARIVKLLRVVTIDPPDDEIHFVLQERHPVSEHSESPNDFAQAEARKIAKKEASRLDRHGGLIKDESRG